MMRGLNMEQKNLHQQYTRVSEEVVKLSKLYQERKTLDDKIWRLMAREGIWKLPVSKEHGGHGQTWQDCLVAMDGFFSHYSDVRCLSSFMSHVGVLYLVSRYGTKAIKEKYLSRLMQGERACLVVSDQIHHLLKKNNCLLQDQASNRRCRILIHAEKEGSDIVFCISEKKYQTRTTVNQPINSTPFTENRFIAKDTGLSALCDLLNFKRIFYAVFSASYARKLQMKYIEQ